MENQDKLFNQIKTAAENAETRDFSSLENVWSRVENKLDKKVLKKENTLWKKIAVAASILLVVSVVYQYLTSDEKLVTPKNDIVVIDTTKTIDNQINKEQKAVSSSEIKNPIIQENTSLISPKSTTQNQIVINNNYTITSAKGSNTIITDSILFTNQSNNTVGFQSKTTIPSRVFESRGVVQRDAEALSPSEEQKKESQNDTKKLDPLLVVDDQVKNSSLFNYTKNDDIETLEVLTDPLYIINGVYYTEKELFGPKPTSPYAPLSKLEIHTISVLQDEKATTIYGEKGKKGVVIITTKTGKPSFKKS